jgi:hypothetical protein
LSHSATSHSLNELEARLSGSLDDNLAGRLPDAGTVAAADSRARHWRYPHPGRLRPGSPEHKAAMCAMFAETFNPYKPSVIAWPKLEPEALHRIVSLPIWDIAVQTEGKARLRMSAYAETLSDPDIREAIARNGWEENRHKEVLSKLVEAYGIPLAPEPEYVKPKDPEWAYMVTGFSECVDSFFAFGLFEMARQSGFFPRGTGRDLRARDAGGMPPYPAFRQLAGLAPRHHADLAAALVRAARLGGLDLPGL